MQVYPRWQNWPTGSTGAMAALSSIRWALPGVFQPLSAGVLRSFTDPLSSKEEPGVRKQGAFSRRDLCGCKLAYLTLCW